MNQKFTEKAKNALSEALTVAAGLGHTYIGSEHLLLSLSAEKDSIASKVLTEKGLSYDVLCATAKIVSGIGELTCPSSADMTPRLKKIIESSARIAEASHAEAIGTEHLLLALLEEKDAVACRLIYENNVSPSELRTSLSHILPYEESFDAGERAEEARRRNRRVSGARQKDFPTLYQYARDMTAAASIGEGDPIIGREQETDRIIQILSRRTKNNPALIGEPGVGKTAVVEGLAQRIASGKVPDSLQSKTLLSLDIASMIAGAKYRGEFEERMKNVMAEAARASDIILFIDEMHMIVGAGAAEGALDAANIIKPALSRGELHMIGATTLDEYRKHIEKDPALERRFQPVFIEEPNIESTRRILRGLKSKYEKHHGITIPDEAIDTACEMANRYIPDRFMPDKAIDLIDEAASRKRIAGYTAPLYVRRAEQAIRDSEKEKENAILRQSFDEAANIKREEEKHREEYRALYDHWRKSVNPATLTLTPEDIAQTVAQWTGIPVTTLCENEEQKLLNLQKNLSEKIIGQSNAIRAVATAIRRGRAGVGEESRPIGSFLFLGPTGVGKTALSRALAQQLFGTEDALIRLDMSEYKEAHSISRLIGSPPGYIGYGDGGQLTERVRRKPYSVILFDEIEKAHPDLYNLLLQILDDGTLTDSAGRKVSFRHSVIIMTSNLGTGEGLRGQMGFSPDEATKQDTRSRKDLLDVFRPEFLNRIDDIITFAPLSDDELERIAEGILKELYKRLAKLGVTVKKSNGIAALIVRMNSERAYGARPLKRIIIEKAETPFTDLFLSGKIKRGDSIELLPNGESIRFVTCPKEDKPDVTESE